MPHNVFLERNAEKDFVRLPKEIQGKIILIISDLKNNPRPVNVKKLLKQESYYRIRVGDYRIVYEVNDKGKTVNIFRIRHRKEAYRF